MKRKLKMLGFPVETYSNLKIARLYPKAILSAEDIIENMSRREYPVHEMEENAIIHLYFMLLDMDVADCQTMIINDINDDQEAHKKNDDALYQHAAFQPELYPEVMHSIRVDSKNSNSS